MEKLTLETFLSGPADMELRQYRILQRIKDHYNEFSHNRLYPALADLIKLHETLTDILNKRGSIQSALPQRLKEFDIEAARLVYEPLSNENADLQFIADLIVWAIPLLKRLIDEGTSIFRFVDERIEFEEVGILPMYREEGYWLIPDAEKSLVHLLRYEISLYPSTTDRFRTLKTRLLESLEQIYVTSSPVSLKHRLIEKYRDLPNPATYYCDTDLEFPYVETLLPVAKRKFMTQFYS